jgi:predicted NBD/HSP70 family sugar kinase
VLFIMSHPGRLSEGKTIDALVGDHEFAPALLEYLDLPGIDPDGLPGCSFRSVLREPNGSGRLTVGVVVQAAAAGDALASQVTDSALRAMEEALVNLLNLLNPEMIVLGGGVFRDGWGIECLRNHIATTALPVAVTSFKGIVPSRLGPAQVGLLGAATLAWNDLAENDITLHK